jgi:hypothetical protein
MDACPHLKICLAHGGGYTCFGIGRMDRGWQVRSEARVNIPRPPSAYLNKFYYDCLTHSEAALRMLIDTAGIDRVIFGTDWPADMAIDWPVSWILSLESLTQEEKEAILGKFHGQRKVDNSFFGRASAYRHCSLCSSLELRLWFTRLSHGVRPFPTANRAKSFPALFR